MQSHGFSTSCRARSPDCDGSSGVAEFSIMGGEWRSEWLRLCYFILSSFELNVVTLPFRGCSAGFIGGIALE